MHPSVDEGSRQEAWAAAVLATQPQVAVFDCDGTLWSGDAGFGFMRWSLAQGLVSPGAEQWMNKRYAGYLAGTVSEAAICGEMVQLYAGLRVSEIREAAARFVSIEIEPLIFPVMETLVGRLREQGTEIWAVSSTSDWVIEAAICGNRVSIPPERILAARVAAEGGLATRRLLAVPTDEAKAEALAEAGVGKPDAVFGNSIHDQAMLRLARHAYPVNPTAALAEQAAHAGWPVFWPGERPPWAAK